MTKLAFLLLIAVMEVLANPLAVEIATQGNQEMGFKAYREMMKKPGNILISPLSVETVLALTMMGARGKTASDMAQTLALPADSAKVAQSFKALEAALHTKSEVTMKTANKIYVDKEIVIKDSFKSVAVDSFSSDIENTDFKEKTASLQKINSWSAEKTNNKITKILEDLDPDTKMVLLNAVYFNGEWVKSFSLEKYPLQFRLNEKDTVDVPRLHIKNHFRYYHDHDLKAQFLEIPYKGDEYSFVIILPEDVNGLAAIEEKLPIDFDSKMYKTEVDVTIPKFKLEQKIEFKPILKNLGMSNAFSSAADFSGISDTPLMISDVIQKTFIDVNEKGTEAAAVTAVIMKKKSSRTGTIIERFTADRPFIFFLLRREPQIKLFIGRYSKPANDL